MAQLICESTPASYHTRICLKNPPEVILIWQRITRSVGKTVIGGLLKVMGRLSQQGHFNPEVGYVPLDYESENGKEWTNIRYF